MVVNTGSEARVHAETRYPLELLQEKYSVLRDEMLWHEYNQIRIVGTEDARRQALQVLQEIREAPE
jgi:hypothetical protein